MLRPPEERRRRAAPSCCRGLVAGRRRWRSRPVGAASVPSTRDARAGCSRRRWPSARRTTTTRAGRARRSLAGRHAHERPSRRGADVHRASTCSSAAAIGDRFSGIGSWTSIDSYDQGGYLEFRQKASRRVSLFVRDNFSVSPTTDLRGSGRRAVHRAPARSIERLHGGAHDTRHQDGCGSRASYHFQWIEFDRPGPAVAGAARRPLAQRDASACTQDARPRRLTLGGRLQRAARQRSGRTGWNAAATSHPERRGHGWRSS